MYIPELASSCLRPPIDGHRRGSVVQLSPAGRDRVGVTELLRRVFSLCCCAPGHHGSNGMAIMVSILVVVIVCTLFYCVYCWRWRKRNGEL